MPAGADAGGRSRGLETRVPGVFAVRDVRAGAVKLVAAVMGGGAQVVAVRHSLLTCYG